MQQLDFLYPGDKVKVTGGPLQDELAIATTIEVQSNWQPNTDDYVVKAWQRSTLKDAIVADVYMGRFDVKHDDLELVEPRQRSRLPQWLRFFVADAVHGMCGRGTLDAWADRGHPDLFERSRASDILFIVIIILASIALLIFAAQKAYHG
jgi:hypothetical protein